MTNVINELQERNKSLAEENNQLKEKFGVNKNNNLTPAEIRQGVISCLKGNYSPSDIDVKAIDIIIKCYCNQENWLEFCNRYPTEPVRKSYILNAYKFNHYYNLTRNLYGVRDDARRNIIVNLVKLNSEESKELFQKWISEGKMEDSITTKRILENGYESDGDSCCRYLDIRHLSLDELISSGNEVTVSVNKKATRVSELEKEVEKLKTELEKSDNKIEELDDEVGMEREEAEKALDAAMRGRKMQMTETVLKHDAAMGKLLDRIDLLENNLAAKNQEINWRNRLENKELPSLPKQQKESRLRKFRQLVSKVKEKTKEEFQTFIVQRK